MESTDTPSDSMIQALSEFSACDCSDALLKLGYPNGGFLAGPTMWSPQRQEGETKIVGRAYTVEYALHNDPRPKVRNHYIDTVPPGAVIFISSPPDIPNAVYGGLMSTRAKVCGAVGTVVDGRIRDLAEHRALRYPGEAEKKVFALATGTTAPQELLKVVAIDQPIRMKHSGQNQLVNPGDYVVGDLNGVVVIPQEVVEKVIPLMKPQVEADEKMAEAIRGGMSFVEASKRFRGK